MEHEKHCRDSTNLELLFGVLCLQCIGRTWLYATWSGGGLGVGMKAVGKMVLLNIQRRFCNVNELGSRSHNFRDRQKI